ncbi:MAG: sensor histidine kinase [Lachnospiraceae bacterium]|nr:sensor histidine kinase [Lachnospiraceae bacterium]
MNSEDLKFIGNIICIIFMAGISTLTVRQYFQIFFEKKKRTMLVGAIEGAYFFWQILSMLGMPTFPMWLRLLLSVVSVTIISFNVKGSMIRRSVFAIIYNAIWMLSELLAGCFFMAVNVDYLAQSLAGSMISKLFLLILVIVLKPFFSHDAVQELPWNYNAMLLSLPTGSMFMAYHLFVLSSKVEEVKYILVSFVIAIIILIVNIVMFRIYMKLSDNLELKHRNSIYQLEIDLYNAHIKEKESAMMEFRQARHDLKHQIIYLLDLSEKKEYAQLEIYLKQLINWEPLEGLVIANTGNFVIDALINYKYSFAKSNNISFCVKLEVPTSLPFEDADLCIILGNALDNAMEAGLRGNVPTPYVDLKMKYDRGNLIMIVENAFDGKIRKNQYGKMLTRKQKLEEHGIGMDSIKRAAEKYNGFLNIENNNEKFCLTILLYAE